jgi:hypothetical protein
VDIGNIFVIFLHQRSLIIYQQLKSIYTTIEDFRANVSGAHWDAENGATIEGASADSVWKDIVKSRVCFFIILFFLAMSFHLIL